MRTFLSLILLLFLAIFGCSESAEPQASIIETLDVTRSKSSSRTFRGNLQHVLEGDTILAYGFAWESRYGDWQMRKEGQLKKGKFALKDTTRLSKWTSFSVRAFIETRNGTLYGNEIKFSTEGE
jgi:hypothetical protein